MNAGLNMSETHHSEPKFPLRRTVGPLNLPPEYAQFREEGPLKKVTLWNGERVWLITRREEVRQFMSNPNISAAPETPGYPALTPARVTTVKNYKTFLTMDPPDHTLFRRMLTGEFTAKRMDELKPKVDSLVDRMLDDIIAEGPPCDLHTKLALRLPVTVVSLLIGVPFEDDEQLVELSAAQRDLSVDPQVATRANQEMLAYVDRIIARKEQNPGDGSDMLGRLVLNQIKPGHLSRKDALYMINLLYFAGHETTANQIGLGVLDFLVNPDQRAKLMADPGLLRNAIEEMLRYNSITHFSSSRVATADIDIGGQTIRKGEGVFALVAAANRDPNVFQNPDKFDIERKNAKDHLTFSFGVHHCLGQPLARLELRAVFERLFKRLPNLRLAVPLEEIQFKENMFVYGVKSLPVSW